MHSNPPSPEGGSLQASKLGEAEIRQGLSDRIWLLTDGDYSDYQVVAAFTSREKAEAFRKRPGYENDDIAEFPLDPCELHHWRWHIIMAKDGAVVNDSFMGPVLRRDIARGGCYFTCGGRGAERQCRLNSNVDTADHTRAVKVTNGRRLHLLAEEAWGDQKKLRTIYPCPQVEDRP